MSGFTNYPYGMVYVASPIQWNCFAYSEIKEDTPNLTDLDSIQSKEGCLPIKELLAHTRNQRKKEASTVTVKGKESRMAVKVSVLHV